MFMKRRIEGNDCAARRVCRDEWEEMRRRVRRAVRVGWRGAVRRRGTGGHAAGDHLDRARAVELVLRLLRWGGFRGARTLDRTVSESAERHGAAPRTEGVGALPWGV